MCYRGLMLRSLLVASSLGLLVAACWSLDTSSVTELASACQAGETKCGDTCVDVTTSSIHCGDCNLKCASGASCTDGRCSAYEAQACNAVTKRPGMQLCDAKCVDTEFSDTDCGACGKACPDGTSCSFGTCKEQCPAPLKFCGAGCVTPSSDKDNCGRCGNACANDERCNFGVCEK